MATGCGGDDDEDDPQPAATVPAHTVPDPVTTPPPETTVKEDDARPETTAIPPQEEQGDEEPIRSEAVFSGSGGKLEPSVVRVPPFIAVRVVLRSSEASRDQGYSLTIGGKRLFIGHTRSTDEVELPGLLPNKAYRGRSPQGDVRVVASAEPGP